MGLRVLLALLVLASGTGLRAQPIVGLADAEALRATVLGVPATQRPVLPVDVPVREIELAIDGALPVPEVFWFNRKLRAWLSPQPHAAPLVIAISGTGSDGDSDRLVMLRQLLWGAGYHVLALPSPTFPRFIVAASSTGVAGDLRQDASDLHRAVRQLLAHVAPELKITGVHAIGYSLGGAHAAALKAVDSTIDGDARIGVDRVVMINPPVDLMASVGRLDQLFERSIGGDEAAFERLYLQLYERLAERYRASDALEVNQDFLLAAAASMPSGPEEHAAAIALAFRIALINLFFAGDLYAGTGVVVDPASPPGPNDPLDGILRQLRHKPYSAYFEQVFVPYYLQRRPGATRASLAAASHLQVIAPLLREDPHVFAQTNADELILDGVELEWLRTTMGSRLLVYPSGGHLGNVGSRRQVADLLQMLQGDHDHDDQNNDHNDDARHDDDGGGDAAGVR